MFVFASFNLMGLPSIAVVCQGTISAIGKNNQGSKSRVALRPIHTEQRYLGMNTL